MNCLSPYHFVRVPVLSEPEIIFPGLEGGSCLKEQILSVYNAEIPFPSSSDPLTLRMIVHELLTFLGFISGGKNQQE